MKLNEKYFLNSLRYASCHAALSSFQSSVRITRIMREMARLAISPNLLHYVPQTSHNPDVVRNKFFIYTEYYSFYRLKTKKI